MTTIETTEQAEALPVGTVLRLTSGQIYARIDTADDGADWQTIGDTYCWGAVEMLNEHPGPATVLHDPTQPAPACDHAVLAAYLASTTALTGASVNEIITAVMKFSEPEPAPASVIDRDTAHLAGGRAYAEGGGPDDVVDAVLDLLPGRTVAQVKAEAWDEGYTQGRLDSVDSVLGDTPSRTNPYRADELEREDT